METLSLRHLLDIRLEMSRRQLSVGPEFKGEAHARNTKLEGVNI